MDAKEIGLRLKEIREEKGQTKRFVARSIGCSYSNICHYEYGLRVPGDEMKIRLANHFGVSVQKLFFANDNHKKK